MVEAGGVAGQVVGGQVGRGLWEDAEETVVWAGVKQEAKWVCA